MAATPENDVDNSDIDLRPEFVVEANGIDVNPINEFSKMNLRENILSGVLSQYKTPSHIQQWAIPSILKHPDKSFIGQAQSGSGKTAAFVISMLQAVDESKNQTQALCVAPTRELVIQTYTVAKLLAQETGIKILLDVPEENLPSVINHHIVIGSPGRIIHSLDKGKLKSSALKIFVIDEADQMLAVQGGNTQTMKIFAKIPQSCQICLFSATFNDTVKSFSKEIIREPSIKIFVKREELSVEKLIQTQIVCNSVDHKFQILLQIFSFVNVGQAIIFAHTRQMAKAIYEFLRKNNFEVSLLHGGDMKPDIRDRTIKDFRDGKNRILVSTNVLARGIDVLQVSLVINYDIPLDQFRNPDPETYLHRVGRTARYNKPGLAINFVHDDYSSQALRVIINTYALKIQEIRPDQLGEIGEKLEKMESSYNKIMKSK